MSVPVSDAPYMIQQLPLRKTHFRPKDVNNDVINIYKAVIGMGGAWVSSHERKRDCLVWKQDVVKGDGHGGGGIVHTVVSSFYLDFY